MKRGKKKSMVNVHTRLPIEVVEALNGMATPENPVYRVLRTILTNVVKGVPAACALSDSTIRELGSVADATGFSSIDELMEHLAAAFLRVYRFHKGELAEDEPTPPEEIRDMFADLTPDNTAAVFADKLSVRKGV